jgi:hypothetical protein
MTTSDHRHPGAKKRPANNPRDCRKFPLIVGPPFIHAAYNFDCSTIGMDLLATRQPEAEPILVLAQGELNPWFELIQP